MYDVYSKLIQKVMVVIDKVASIKIKRIKRNYRD